MTIEKSNIEQQPNYEFHLGFSWGFVLGLCVMGAIWWAMTTSLS